MTARRISVPVQAGQMGAYLALPDSGAGPGILILQEIFGINANIRAVADLYAAEGYVALAPDLFWRLEPGVELGYEGADRERAFALMDRFDQAAGIADLEAAAAQLRALPECTGQIGAVGFCLGGRLAVLLAATGDIDAAISYYGVGLETLTDRFPHIACPLLLHFGERDRFSPPPVILTVSAAIAAQPHMRMHVYPGADHGFSAEGRAAFDKPAALMAHSRSVALLRDTIGPRYDLSALWDKHCEYEFGLRDVPKTMATMVPEPYVNHVPTMTGGVGFRELSRFYKHHFVDANPADTKLVPISRTIGSDRVVDEMLFSFTHDREIDWMLPGIAPTGRKVEVPLIAIIAFRGDKLFNEHIYWDQASVLVQIGLLDPKLLPISGREQSAKLLDPTQPSNTLMHRWSESAMAEAAE